MGFIGGRGVGIVKLVLVDVAVKLRACWRPRLAGRG